jgi:hypothetical protein
MKESVRHPGTHRCYAGRLFGLYRLLPRPGNSRVSSGEIEQKIELHLVGNPQKREACIFLPGMVYLFV